MAWYRTGGGEDVTSEVQTQTPLLEQLEQTLATRVLGEDLTPEFTTQNELIESITEGLVGKATGANATAETIVKGYSAYVGRELVQGAADPFVGSFENLLSPTLVTTTQSGITCTDNGDGSYTLNGTATEARDFWLTDSFKLSNGSYKFVAMPSSHGNDAVSVFDVTSSVWIAEDTGSGATFTADSSHEYKICMICRNGSSFSNFTIKPIITTNLNVKYDNWYPKIKNVENLLVPTLATTTRNGVTCTNNGDGTYTFNGTASAQTDIALGYIEKPNGTVRFLGCPYSGSALTYRLVGQMATGTGGGQVDMKSDYGNGVTIDCSSYTTANYLRLFARIMEGYTCNNLIFKPMITTNLSATYDNFVKRVGGFNNLLSLDFSTTTKNGVTFTNNNDGTVTVNGTASASATVFIYQSDTGITTDSGWTKLTGNPSVDSKCTLLAKYSDGAWVYDTGSGGKSATGAVTDVAITVPKGNTVNNVIIKPMITESLLPEYYDFVASPLSDMLKMEVSKKISTIPVTSYMGCCVFYKGEFHILGGSTNTSGTTNHYKYRADTNDWISVSTLPHTSTTYMQSVVYNNEIHIIGSGQQHYKYNDSTGTWTSVSTPPVGVYQGHAVIYNNEIHILSGSSVTTGHYSYNGSSWTASVTLPYDARSGACCTYNGVIHLLGSGANSTYYTYHYTFDGTSWTKLSENTPISCQGTCAVVFKNKIHLLGGKAATYHYTFDGTSWEAADDLPFAFPNDSGSGKTSAAGDKCIHVASTTNHGIVLATVYMKK